MIWGGLLHKAKLSSSCASLASNCLHGPNPAATHSGKYLSSHVMFMHTPCTKDTPVRNGNATRNTPITPQMFWFTTTLQFPALSVSITSRLQSLKWLYWREADFTTCVWKKRSKHPSICQESLDSKGYHWFVVELLSWIYITLLRMAPSLGYVRT